MAAAVGNPGDGGASARVLGLDVVLLAGRGLGGVLGGAAVGLEPLVAELTAHGDGEDVVGGAVHTEVGDGGVAAAAARELGAGNDGYGLEDVW